ncbi:MAG: hypothetical protein ACE3K2_28865 [Paenibacillus sp.]|uniref:hypothetical protein n=1 Tax=Paenibacillus TaxID=44249 RepID=UPI0020650FBB|nr:MULTISPECIES: hypothetical protein [Paenibacillus]MCP1425436.1 hypothetical protein [Paenibacillus xylanexedens]UOK64993.1 hypothetical protein MT997_11730 [Paenibacillus sp. OVF10]WJM09785.1 hypothetical protein QNO02_07630 [Paenibacillus sp. PK1-4R]
MKPLQIIKMPPYFKILNCNITEVLDGLLIEDNSILFLDIYHEEDLDTYLSKNKVLKLDNVIQIIDNSNKMSFIPYIKSKKDLLEQYRYQDWDFSCIVFDKNLKCLFYIRGIEDAGENGIRIKEMEPNLYNKYFFNYQE